MSVRINFPASLEDLRSTVVDVLFGILEQIVQVVSFTIRKEEGIIESRSFYIEKSKYGDLKNIR